MSGRVLTAKRQSQRNVQLSEQEAKEFARKSLSLWLPKFEAVRENKASTTTTGEDGAGAATAAEATAIDPVEASIISAKKCTIIEAHVPI